MVVDASAPPARPDGVEFRVIRSVGRCLALLLVSLGGWGYAWVWHTTNEVSQQLDDREASPGLRVIGSFIPFVNIYVLYLCWRDVNAYCVRSGARGFPVVPYVLVSLLVLPTVYTYPVVQQRLNAAHAAACGGTAIRARMTTADWIACAYGVLLWALFVGGFVAGATSGSSS